MKKVLQIAGGMNRAGLETFIMNIYRKINRNVFQFDFLIWQETADYMEEIESMGGHVYSITARRHSVLNFHKNLNSFFKEHADEYEAVHLHCSSLSLVEPLYYAKKYGIPLRIIHSHSSNQKGVYNKILHYVNKLFISGLATHYYACSEKAAKWFYNHTSVCRKHKIINNGVDCNIFKYNATRREEMRNKLHIGSNELVIGHIGRFNPVKNHKFLVDIFEEIYRIRPNSKLMLVGDGPLYKSIESLVIDKGLEQNTYFLGLRNDTNDLLQAMDIFVMPSIYEGLPVTLVEAQAAGLPIVCSDTISQMSNISNNYYVHSLDEAPKEWAKDIIERVQDFERQDTSQIIKNKGFDIIDTVNYLTSVYFDK